MGGSQHSGTIQIGKSSQSYTMQSKNLPLRKDMYEIKIKEEEIQVAVCVYVYLNADAVAIIYCPMINAFHYYNSVAFSFTKKIINTMHMLKGEISKKIFERRK